MHIISATFLFIIIPCNFFISVKWCRYSIIWVSTESLKPNLAITSMPLYRSQKFVRKKNRLSKDNIIEILYQHEKVDLLWAMICMSKWYAFDIS